MDMDLEKPAGGGVSPKDESRKKAISTIIVMVVITFLLWDERLLAPFHLGWLSLLVYPVKIFVVFLHELSHGLAAIATGGRIVSITLSPDQGGLCQHMTNGKLMSQIITASAGYLGSMFWGCVMLIASIKLRNKKPVNLFIGIVMIAAMIMWIRDLFPVVFCTLFGGAMILLGTKLSEDLNSLALKYLGTVSCMYSLVDIPDDLIFRTVTNAGNGVGSDSYAIASALGMPFLSVPIGILWMIMSVAALWQTYKIAMK